jgi:hypothetical protein
MVLCPDGRYATCESIEDARRLARLSAAGAKPCELTVCDAYHRVVEHELIDGVTNEDQPVLVG